MRGLGPRMLWLWAARDLSRRPGEALLTAGALAALVATVATSLLLHQAVEATVTRLYADGPSLVVTRLGPAGWQPIPADAVDAVATVPGALRPRLRVWGTARADDLPLTIVGVDRAAADALTAAGLPAPAVGEVVLGPGAGAIAGSFLPLRGPGEPRDPFITHVLPTDLGLVAHDAALLHVDDARALLGVPPGHGTDLAVDVHHDGTEAAIRPELAAALPFPVVITTRTEARGATVAGLSRRGGLGLLLLLPALLALALLIASAARDRAGRAAEVGLLKAMGWTTADVVRLSLARALAVGLPAVALGGATAVALVLWPGVSWPGALLLGWEGPPPALHLDAGGAALVLAEVGAFALLPWLAASLWPAVRGATRDPQELLLADAGGR